MGTVTIGIGMDVKGSTIAGESEVGQRNQTGSNGGRNSSEEEELLEIALEVEREVFTRSGPISESLSDLRIGLLKLNVLLELASLSGVIQSILGIFERGKELGRQQGLKRAAGVLTLKEISRPEPIDKGVVGADGRNGNGIAE